MVFRFLLGTGEAANWPGATKAVAEWFPKTERGWAVALFDSGSGIRGGGGPPLAGGALSRLRQLAPRLRRDGNARLQLDAGVAAILPSAGDSSPARGRGARIYTERQGGRGREWSGSAPTVARPARHAADLGHHTRAGAHRPGLVLCRRLVRDLPGVEGIPPGERSRRLLDSLPGRRPG